jgi:hypothetical protein
VKLFFPNDSTTNALKNESVLEFFKLHLKKDKCVVVDDPASKTLGSSFGVKSLMLAQHRVVLHMSCSIGSAISAYEREKDLFEAIGVQVFLLKHDTPFPNFLSGSAVVFSDWQTVLVHRLALDYSNASCSTKMPSMSVFIPAFENIVSGQYRSVSVPLILDDLTQNKRSDVSHSLMLLVKKWFLDTDYSQELFKKNEKLPTLTIDGAKSFNEFMLQHLDGYITVEMTSLLTRACHAYNTAMYDMEMGQDYVIYNSKVLMLDKKTKIANMNVVVEDFLFIALSLKHNLDWKQANSGTVMATLSIEDFLSHQDKIVGISCAQHSKNYSKCQIIKQRKHVLKPMHGAHFVDSQQVHLTEFQKFISAPKCKQGVFVLVSCERDKLSFKDLPDTIIVFTHSEYLEYVRCGGETLPVFDMQPALTSAIDMSVSQIKCSAKDEFLFERLFCKDGGRFSDKESALLSALTIRYNMKSYGRPKDRARDKIVNVWCIYWKAVLKSSHGIKSKDVMLDCLLNSYLRQLQIRLTVTEDTATSRKALYVSVMSSLDVDLNQDLQQSMSTLDFPKFKIVIKQLVVSKIKTVMESNIHTRIFSPVGNTLGMEQWSPTDKHKKDIEIATRKLLCFQEA